MTKFFIILIIIVTASYLIVSFILNKVRKFLSGFAQSGNHVDKEKKNKDEILYDKDGVQVLKGYAEEKKKDKED
jgi:hypothetical protein